MADEMGSYDPMLSAFTPTKYLGTTNSTSCVTGYDQITFIAGTSSEIFNGLNGSVRRYFCSFCVCMSFIREDLCFVHIQAAALATSIVGPIIEFLNASIPQPGVELDVALYPNPFFGVANGTFIDSSETALRLVDGGEDGEVIPVQPLLVKAREVDVIVVIDAVRAKYHAAWRVTDEFCIAVVCECDKLV